jgi:DNA polymerase
MKPDLIITLGRFSFNFLVPDVSIADGHGNTYKIQNIGDMMLTCMPVVLSIYHPAVALYNPNKKSVIEEDLRKIPEILKKLH